MHFLLPAGEMAAPATSAQKQTRVTGEVECGWANFPGSFVLKEGEGNDGEVAGIGGAVCLLQEVSEYTVILVPSPLPPLARWEQHLPDAVAGWGRGCFPPVPVRSCFWLDHRTPSCQSSCGYPERGRISQHALRNLSH